MGFRNGQWVKFQPAEEIPGAHVVDGWTVGIFQRGAVDGLGQATADRVMVVCPKGHNVAYLEDGQVKTREVAPADAPGLCAVLDVGDMPEARRKTMRDGFVPKA